MDMTSRRLFAAVTCLAACLTHAWAPTSAARPAAHTVCAAVKHSRRYNDVSALRERNEYYKLEEGIQVLKTTASAKFDESVDVAINLGIDPKRSDQNVRGMTVLPCGTGKTVRVAVFAEEGPDADAATEAGADLVGLEDLSDTVAKGTIEFDTCIATPAAMKVIVAKLGRILGPRGLMPNAKVGTVTTDVMAAVKAAKGGQVQFRADKGAVVHAPIGKASFDEEGLKDNLIALLDALNAAKPAAAKGVYIKTISMSTTMGPGLKIDRSSVPVSK